MPFVPSQTISEIVHAHPSSAGVFEALGIDTCAGGAKSLAEACIAANAPLRSVVADLECAADGAFPVDDGFWRTAPLGELTDMIVLRHHSFARRELLRLSVLADKVYGRYGEEHPELGPIRDLIEALGAELFPHMLREERILFPIIRELGNGGAARNGVAISTPIRHMMEEHDDSGALLRKIRALTCGYQPPPGACASYSALYAGLEAFEADMNRHVHLENDILFPRALACGGNEMKWAPVAEPGYRSPSTK